MHKGVKKSPQPTPCEKKKKTKMLKVAFPSFKILIFLEDDPLRTLCKRAPPLRSLLSPPKRG